MHLDFEVDYKLKNFPVYIQQIYSSKSKLILECTLSNATTCLQ